MRLVGSIVFTYSFGLVSLWKLISGYWTSYLLLNVGALKNTCKVTCDRKSTPIDCEELLLCGFFQQQGNFLMEHYAYLVYISRTWFLVGFYYFFCCWQFSVIKTNILTYMLLCFVVKPLPHTMESHKHFQLLEKCYILNCYLSICYSFVVVIT